MLTEELLVLHSNQALKYISCQVFVPILDSVRTVNVFIPSCFNKKTHPVFDIIIPDFSVCNILGFCGHLLCRVCDINMVAGWKNKRAIAQSSHIISL